MNGVVILSTFIHQIQITPRQNFDEHVKQVVADFSATINTDRKMHDCNDVIMPGEVEIVCKQLKLNKACGYDGIRAEKTTYFVLNRVLSAMFLNGYRTECMKRGIIIPMPKGRTDHSDPNNFLVHLVRYMIKSY